MDNSFLRSLFVMPPKCLGCQLRPFSAYHLAALQLLESPLAIGGEVTHDDLVLAVFVCSHGITDGPRKLFPVPDMAEVRDMAGRYNWEYEREVFNQYAADYMMFPEIWSKESGNSKRSALPVPWLLVCDVLRNHGGITRQQAWDMPLCELAGYRIALAEANGMDIVDERLIGIKEAAEAEERAMKGKA